MIHPPDVPSKLRTRACSFVYTTRGDLLRILWVLPLPEGQAMRDVWLAMLPDFLGKDDLQGYDALDTRDAIGLTLQCEYLTRHRLNELTEATLSLGWRVSHLDAIPGSLELIEGIEDNPVLRCPLSWLGERRIKLSRLAPFIGVVLACDEHALARAHRDGHIPSPGAARLHVDKKNAEIWGEGVVYVS